MVVGNKISFHGGCAGCSLAESQWMDRWIKIKQNYQPITGDVAWTELGKIIFPFLQFGRISRISKMKDSLS